MKNIVVFSGAGISAESGIKTFRDNDGLWENYNVEEVATPQAWKKDPEKVLEFYNQRRAQLLKAKPNKAHQYIAELQKYYKVKVITQNIDDLHELAGSKFVLHLHGELKKAQSSINPQLVYPIDGSELRLGEKCKLGSQLRPHVVWFGEAVPKMDDAFLISALADIFIVIGTSLNVYPAAMLLDYIPKHADRYIIDPKIPELSSKLNFTQLQTSASQGMEILFKKIKEKI